jgi:undecaprenyl-diphosphatase
MSAAGGLDKDAAPCSWWRQIDHNARQTLATLLRKPRRRLTWPQRLALALGAGLAVVAVLAAMVALDASAIEMARRLPRPAIVTFDRLTDLGKAGYFLWPVGIALLALAALDAPALPRAARGVLAAFAVRLGFVFTAIAVPGVFVSIAKRVIGRARPSFVGGNVWTYHPFAWRPEFASLPSGHATTAFAALVAIGAIVPQARAFLWIYAVLIAVSRVAVVAHYPSDVVAGAVIGLAGALVVQRWFAARGLGFAVGPGGSVRPMPGPGLERIVKAVARCLHTP